jgi:hypothetical protein
MEAVSIERSPARGSREEKLWRAVIANPVRERIHGPVRLRRKAKQYRFQSTEDYKQKSSEGKYSWS